VGKTMPYTIPQITLVIGGMFTIPKRVLYGIVLPTLTILNFNDHINPLKKHRHAEFRPRLRNP
jgi:hypothetical protein